MSHEREYMQDGIVVKVRHRTLVEQLFERPCVIRRYGTFQFTDALGHDHAFGGVFFADEDGE